MFAAWLRSGVVLFGAVTLSAASASVLAAPAATEPSVASSVSQAEAPAAQAESVVATTAHEVVEQVTSEMIAVINTNKALLASKPDEYFAKVDAVLEPVVAFPYIAKIVMSKHYKAASKEQRGAFAAAFQQTMVETIAKGMANYADSNITVREPKEDVSGQRKVEVLQDVKGADGNHLVSYTMAKNKEGQWKLINVVLNGVNLGKSFRDQYTQAARQLKNDYDKVTANWGKKES